MRTPEEFRDYYYRNLVDQPNNLVELIRLAVREAVEDILAMRAPNALFRACPKWQEEAIREHFKEYLNERTDE